MKRSTKIGTLASAPILALTVQPPWSHWLARGIKQVENRTWVPSGSWRGTLVIHAGKKIDRPAFAFGARLGHPVDEDDVNRGEFIAVAELADVHHAGATCAAACAQWGQPDRIHWVLTGVRRLTTIEGRGRQGLFVPPPDVLEHVRETLNLDGDSHEHVRDD